MWLNHAGLLPNIWDVGFKIVQMSTLVVQVYRVLNTEFTSYIFTMMLNKYDSICTHLPLFSYTVAKSIVQ